MLELECHRNGTAQGGDGREASRQFPGGSTQSTQLCTPSFTAGLTTSSHWQYKLSSLNSIYEIHPLEDPRWSDFVRAHPKSSVFHSVNWLNALHRAYGYQIAALSVSPGARLTSGLVFCRIKSRVTGNRIVSLPFSDHCEPLAETRQQIDAMLLELKNITAEQRWRYCEVRPTSYDPNESSAFQKSFRYWLHTIDLAGSCGELFRGFHKDCVQRKIRRAERESLDYKSGNSEELLMSFYHLFVQTRRRHHVPPQHHSWFRHLSRTFGDELQFRLAFQKGIPVAAILTLKYNKTVTYKYGCSDARFSNLGGTALLFWNTIQEAKSEGMTEFDLGRSDPVNNGLVAFKEHWGARRSVVDYWRFPARRRHARSAGMTRLAQKLVEIAPEWSLIAAGKLLYPHIA